MINEFDFTSSAIGVGAIAITKDGFVVLIRRALWTGEAAGKIDRPGGHPEPDEALKVDFERFRNYFLIYFGKNARAKNCLYCLLIDVASRMLVSMQRTHCRTNACRQRWLEESYLNLSKEN